MHIRRLTLAMTFLAQPPGSRLPADNRPAGARRRSRRVRRRDSVRATRPIGRG
jgi:hypothetical protein